MGITGLSKAIGPGKDIALAKLVDETFLSVRRRVRIAIDISIWFYESQKSEGGWNPRLRLLYFRFVRLLRASVQPLFVFDGPHKPPFKRHKKTVPRGDSRFVGLTKQLIELFGFDHHEAPGEAEAECALLQQRGIVDAVLSEDIDTLMFGCKSQLRAAQRCASKRGLSFELVSLHELETIERTHPGLDRDGMILIALMSGGDYLPEGIPGCGIKVACEAARAGYGTSLCNQSSSNDGELGAWREDLAFQLLTNEKKYFRTRHPALKVPEAFPDPNILRYYTHPVISSEAQTAVVTEKLEQSRAVAVQRLYDFVIKHFRWGQEPEKFIRQLAPAVLMAELSLACSQITSSDVTDVMLSTNTWELEIHGQRQNPLDETITELRLAFNPSKVVELAISPPNFATQVTDPDSGGSDEDLDFTDSNAVPRIWISKTILEMSVPQIVLQYERSLQEKYSKETKRRPRVRSAKKTTATSGPMDKFVRVTKPVKNTLESTHPKDRGRQGDAIGYGFVKTPALSENCTHQPQVEPPQANKGYQSPTPSGSTRSKDLKAYMQVVKPESQTFQSLKNDRPFDIALGDSLSPPQFHSSATPIDLTDNDGSPTSVVLPPPNKSDANSTGTLQKTQAGTGLMTQVMGNIDDLTSTTESIEDFNAKIVEAQTPHTDQDTRFDTGSSNRSSKVLNRMDSRHGHRVYVARQSLEGAWKEIDEATYQTLDPRQRQRGAWRASQVSVVDLTEDD